MHQPKDHLEQVQNLTGRFILQIPGSSSRVIAWLDAGLKPMQHRIIFKKAMFIWSTLKKNQNPSLLASFRHILDTPDDQWTMSWMSIQRTVDLICGFDTKQEITQALNKSCIDYIMHVKASHDTMQTVPQPAKWYSSQQSAVQSSGW